METEWDYSGRNGRNGQKKKICKANERKRKVKRGKDEEVNGQGGRGVPGPTRGELFTVQSEATVALSRREYSTLWVHRMQNFAGRLTGKGRTESTFTEHERPVMTCITTVVNTHGSRDTHLLTALATLCQASCCHENRPSITRLT